MWGNDEQLERWFADVKMRRGNTDTGSQMERVPEADLTEDTLAARMIGDLRG